MCVCDCPSHRWKCVSDHGHGQAVLIIAYVSTAWIVESL
jgi:hypothetical protein